MNVNVFSPLGSPALFASHSRVIRRSAVHLIVVVVVVFTVVDLNPMNSSICSILVFKMFVRFGALLLRVCVGRRW